MKKLMSIIFVWLLVQSLALGQQSPAQKKATAEKKAADERQRSFGGYRNTSQLKNPAATQRDTTAADSAQQQAASHSGQVIPSNEDQPQTADSSNGQFNPEKSNAPAVIQTTTSESGSPSILSENNGRGRDGTGNVQRSTPNMAGAEVPGNMDLSKKNSSEKNISSGVRVKKKEDQPAQVSERKSDQQLKDGAERNPAQAQQIKPATKQSDKEQRKAKRKNRRNKDRNSGK